MSQPGYNLFASGSAAGVDHHLDPAVALAAIRIVGAVGAFVGATGRLLRGKDYRAVEDVLRQLLALTFTKGDVDCGVERDFLDRLPPWSIDVEVARQYDEYCRARGRLPGPPDGPDEPPKWEPPEWETGR